MMKKKIKKFVLIIVATLMSLICTTNVSASEITLCKYQETIDIYNIGTFAWELVKIALGQTAAKDASIKYVGQAAPVIITVNYDTATQEYSIYSTSYSNDVMARGSWNTLQSDGNVYKVPAEEFITECPIAAYIDLNAYNDSRQGGDVGNSQSVCFSKEIDENVGNGVVNGIAKDDCYLSPKKSQYWVTNIYGTSFEYGDHGLGIMAGLAQLNEGDTSGIWSGVASKFYENFLSIPGYISKISNAVNLGEVLVDGLHGYKLVQSKRIYDIHAKKEEAFTEALQDFLKEYEIDKSKGLDGNPICSEGIDVDQIKNELTSLLNQKLTATFGDSSIFLQTLDVFMNEENTETLNNLLNNLLNDCKELCGDDEKSKNVALCQQNAIGNVQEFINALEGILGDNYSIELAEDWSGDETCLGFLGDPRVPGSVAYYIQLVLNILRYTAIALTVVLTSIDFFKAIVNQDKDALMKAAKTGAIRLILAIVLFFLPIIINFIMSLIGAYSSCVS